MARGKKRFDYGLILIERLKRSQEEFLDVRTIAREHNLPTAFLEKVAQEFKRAGWLESRRGLGGGYRLIRDPNTITVQTLINYFERPYEICPISRVEKK